MPHEPRIDELIEAVRAWIKAEVMPKLDGYAQFRGRVALGALGTVQRELAQRPTADAEARERLRDLLGQDGSLDELERVLCARIADGALGVGDAALMTHLRRTALDRLAIDQPKVAETRRMR
jgi:hypothetical protein